MPRVTHTPLDLPGGFPSLPISAGAVSQAGTAADATNKEQTPLTGREIVVCHNTGAGARTVTFTSVADGQTNRSGDISAYSIPAGEVAFFGPFPNRGWRQTDGNLYFEAEHAEVEIHVLRLPVNN